jgi:acyl-CoA synthetase (AMP-forming)/AMP-acid ligase II
MLNNKIKKFLEISFKVTFIDIYGITECCGYIAINDNKNEYSNSIGKLLHSRNITLRPSTDIGEYDEYPLTLMKQLTNQTRTFGELVCAFCGEEYNTGDYFVKQCCSSNKGEEYFYYVEKIKLFMHFDRDKVIEVKRAEVDEIETFGGVVNNVYLGFNGLMHKGVVVVHLAPNWKGKEKGVDDEKVYQHFIEVVKRTNKGNGGRFWERNVDKKVFYIHKGERFFTPKMKINKGVLYKEIEKYFDCLK